MKSPEPNAVTTILARARQGDPLAVEQLFPLVYEELHRLAGIHLARERRNHTLQPTALVNEAFLRMVGKDQMFSEDRSHFLRVAAKAMRRILIDYARRRKAEKRGGKANPIPLESAATPMVTRDEYLIALDESLEQLAKLDERQARVVELRFFGGLNIEETARVLGVGHATVERDWKMAKAWLHQRITLGDEA